MSTAQPIFPEKKSKTQASVSRKRKSEADPIAPIAPIAPPAKKPKLFKDSMDILNNGDIGDFKAAIKTWEHQHGQHEDITVQERFVALRRLLPDTHVLAVLDDDFDDKSTLAYLLCTNDIRLDNASTPPFGAEPAAEGGGGGMPLHWLYGAAVPEEVVRFESALGISEEDLCIDLDILENRIFRQENPGEYKRDRGTIEI